MSPDAKEALKYWIAIAPLVVVAIALLLAIPFLLYKMVAEAEHPWIVVVGLAVFVWLTVGLYYLANRRHYP